MSSGEIKVSLCRVVGVITCDTMINLHEDREAADCRLPFDLGVIQELTNAQV